MAITKIILPHRIAARDKPEVRSISSDPLIRSETKTVLEKFAAIITEKKTSQSGDPNDPPRSMVASSIPHPATRKK
jgi:hypothetical protein